MTVALKGFCRHVDNETLLCNLKQGSSIVLRDAEEFLRSLLVREDIVYTASVLANKYHLSADVISNDLLDFYGALVRQDIVEMNNGCYANKSLRKENDLCTSNAITPDKIEPSPIGDFFRRHNIVAELHLDLTYVCTERCIHCYVPQVASEYLPYSIIEKLLHEFRDQQGLTVRLSGGECMTHPDFAKICCLCRKLDLNFIVLSNLTLCDEEIVAVLKETNPQFVNVSLYSMKAEEHDSITQVTGSWAKTMAAIDACLAAGIHIRLATPLLKANRHAYPLLQKFAAERRVHLIPDCEIIPKNNGDCSNLCYACSAAEVESTMRSNVQLWNFGFSKREPKHRVCDIGERVFVNVRGEYYPCSGMNNVAIGNAKVMTLSELWKCKRMKYLRSLKNKDFSMCVDCEHSAFCKICPAFNFNATGSLFEPIPAKCALAEVKHRVFGGK